MSKCTRVTRCRVNSSQNLPILLKDAQGCWGCHCHELLQLFTHLLEANWVNSTPVPKQVESRANQTPKGIKMDKGITQSILRFLHFGYTASCWPTPKNSHSVRFECGRQAFNPRPAYSKAWISGHTSEKSQQIQWFHINSLGCELN